jgi:hypothetical protein
MLRSVWAHEDFHLKSETGDILQNNPKATDKFDRLMRGWVGVVLHNAARPDSTLGATSNIMSPGNMFHGKAITFDNLRRSTTDSGQSDVQEQESAKSVKLTALAEKQCQEWIEGLIRKSPHARAATVDALWIDALGRWPGKLSKRAFLRARERAIEVCGASGWKAAGRTRKSSQA